MTYWVYVVVWTHNFWIVAIRWFGGSNNNSMHPPKPLLHTFGLVNVTMSICCMLVEHSNICCNGLRNYGWCILSQEICSVNLAAFKFRHKVTRFTQIIQWIQRYINQTVRQTWNENEARWVNSHTVFETAKSSLVAKFNSVFKFYLSFWITWSKR